MRQFTRIGPGLGAGSGLRAGVLLVTAGVATSVCLGAGAISAVAATGAAAAAHSAVYQQDSSWGSGFQGEYTITNTGSTAEHGWKLEFDLPAGVKLTSVWGGQPATAGQHITVSPESWNIDLAPGSVTTVGFVATGSGQPSGCLIDGASCSGSAPAPSGTPAPPIGTPTPAPTTAAPTAPPSKAPTAPPTTAPPTTAPVTTAPPASTAPAPPTGSGPAAAPYVDTSLYPPFDLLATSKATGIKVFNLAFVVAGSGCTPEWGGVTAIGNDAVAAQISALRAAGGDVRVSFGGAAGSELAQVCTTSTALAAAYRTVIDAYGLTKIDFDIEGAAIEDTAANARRAAAVSLLQHEAVAAGKPLDVSLTLPVLPSGLTQDGLNVVSGMNSAGGYVSTVNVMAMDFGSWAAPSPAGKMGQYAIQAATSTEAQVKSLYGGTDAQAWARVAVTPMIGVNDDSEEVFTVADAQQLVAFAKTVHLAWLSMWSGTRDKACAGGTESYADATCSSIAQDPLAFSKALAGYTG